ncbi:MAG: glutaredoxin domain-containing protein [Myxococcota bacterium]
MAAPPPGLPVPDDVSAPVLIYTTPLCGYCRAALALLRARDIEHLQVDVSGQPQARRWMFEVTQQRTVPQIFVRGRSIGGYTELAQLDQSGQLERLLAGSDPP